MSARENERAEQSADEEPAAHPQRKEMLEIPARLSRDILEAADGRLDTNLLQRAVAMRVPTNRRGEGKNRR